MPDLLDRRILFVGGKGGVGKTTIASSLALIAADRKQRCLLVSTDPAHSLSDIFEKPVTKRKTALSPRLWGLEIDPDSVADEHIETIKYNMRSLVRPAMYDQIDKQMNLARLAPGLVESAMLERISELMIDSRNAYDLVIFDTAPTGHTLRLLSLPEIMTAWTDGLLKQQKRSSDLGDVLGRLDRESTKLTKDEQPLPTQNAGSNDKRNHRIRSILLQRIRKFRRARRLLLDNKQSAFILVLNPEKLPLMESQKAYQALKQMKIPVQLLIVNRVLPDIADGEFLSNRRQQEAEYLADIKNSFQSLKRCNIPLLSRDVHGPESLNIVKCLLEKYV